ncbi:MAG: hypothetical protein QXP95_07995, partial [Candidatus Nezhaarchaeales archaeon]
NLRLIYDTIFKKGASIKFEPSKPKLSDYDLVVVASPIWIGTLSSPIQEFLKRHATMCPLHNHRLRGLGCSKASHR